MSIPAEALSLSQQSIQEAREGQWYTALRNLVNVLDAQEALTEFIWDGALEPYLSGKAERAAARAVLADHQGQEAVEQRRILEGYRLEVFTLAKFAHYWLKGRPRDAGAVPLIGEVQQSLIRLSDLVQQEEALWERQQARIRAQEEA